MTRLACRQAGWGFERVGVPEEVLLANVRWLSRYRHPRCRRGAVVDRLPKIFAAPVRLMAGADAVGDRLETLPVLFHLLWLRELAAEGPSVGLLGPSTIVRMADGSLNGTRRLSRSGPPSQPICPRWRCVGGPASDRLCRGLRSGRHHLADSRMWSSVRRPILLIAGLLST